MAQICAQALGVDYRKIRVIHGQTDRIAYGIGAHASRATVLTGSAVHVTSLKLREKVLSFASDLLQTRRGRSRHRGRQGVRAQQSARRLHIDRGNRTTRGAGFADPWRPRARALGRGLAQHQPDGIFLRRACRPSQRRPGNRRRHNRTIFRRARSRPSGQSHARGGPDLGRMRAGDRRRAVRGVRYIPTPAIRFLQRSPTI